MYFHEAMQTSEIHRKIKRESSKKSPSKLNPFEHKFTAYKIYRITTNSMAALEHKNWHYDSRFCKTK